jgi:hypothetical protein
MEFIHFFLSDIQILDRNNRFIPGKNWAECGNIPAAHGTKVQTLNGNVVLDRIYKAHINSTSIDIFHSNKTYSSIPFGYCRKCEPLSERPQPVRPLPPASGLADSPLGAGKLELQAGWSRKLLGPQGTIRMLNRLNLEAEFSRVRLEAH